MPDPTKQNQTDADAALGAVEGDTSDSKSSPDHTPMSGQLGHRDQDDMLKSADSDFPEPDATGEHSGENSS